MSRHFTILRVAALTILALIVFTISRTGYSQNATTFGQSVQCQPFQQTVKFDISAGDATSVGTFAVANRTRITIEQISLRIDAVTTIAPAVAALTTTVGSMRSAYYVPIPVDVWFVTPARPLALMQAAALHADGGTTVALSVSVDPRYASGSGRAEWSVSGQSCGS